MKRKFQLKQAILQYNPPGFITQSQSDDFSQEDEIHAQLIATRFGFPENRHLHSNSSSFGHAQMQKSSQDSKSLRNQIETTGENDEDHENIENGVKESPTAQFDEELSLTNPAMVVIPWFDQQVAIIRVVWPPVHSKQSFHFLIMQKSLFNAILNPFEIARKFPAPWHTSHRLETLHWQEEWTSPLRSAAKLQSILKNGNSPWLLGAAQALIEDGKMILYRHQPMNAPIEHLWELLPYSVQQHITFSSLCFKEDLDLNIMVLPVENANNTDHPETAAVPGYFSEEQILDFPDGRYEHSLQIAIQSGDQREIDLLFARRNSRQTLKMMILLLLGLALASFLMKAL